MSAVIDYLVIGYLIIGMLTGMAVFVVYVYMGIDLDVLEMRF